MYNPFPYRFTKDVFFKRVFISLFLVAIGYIIYQLQSVILPFLVAFILSYAINPLVQKFTGQGTHSPLGGDFAGIFVHCADDWIDTLVAHSTGVGAVTIGMEVCTDSD